MKSNPFLFGLVSIMWPFFTNFHFQWRQTPHRRYMKKQTRLLVWGLTSQPQWKPPTVSRVHPLPALPPPLNNQSISGMELELREWGTIKLVERLSAVKKIPDPCLYCCFQGVPFYLWSAYLAGLSWQTCGHWTGERSFTQQNLLKSL